MFNKFIQRPVLSIVISLIIVFLGVLAMTQFTSNTIPFHFSTQSKYYCRISGSQWRIDDQISNYSSGKSHQWCPGMKYMASDAGNDGEATIQVVFNLGTDPNQASLNVQNRVASVVNKLPPLVVREGVKITREESNMLMYINLYSKDPKTDQKFLFNFADINILVRIKKGRWCWFCRYFG